MSINEKLANVVNRYDELEALISAPGVAAEDLVKMNKEISQLAPVVEAVKNFNRLQGNMEDAKSMMDDSSLDKEMREMAETEYYELKEKLPELEKEIKILLLPKDEDDEKNAILEVRAGTAATKPLCLPRCCLKCISAIRGCRDGNLKSLMPMKTALAAISRLRPKLPAKTFLPNSNLNPAPTGCSGFLSPSHRGGCILRRRQLPFCPKLKKWICILTLPI